MVALTAVLAASRARTRRDDVRLLDVWLDPFRPSDTQSDNDLWIDKTRRAANGRWMANYVLTVLVILFDFARERGSIEANLARGVRRITKDNNRAAANRPREVAECRAVLDEAPSDSCSTRVN